MINTYLQEGCDVVEMARTSKRNKKEEIPQALVIGDTKFRPITSKERKIIDKNRKYWINSYEWSIDYAKYDKFNWKQLFQIIEQSCIQNLWLNDNNSKDVFKSLPNSNFYNLKILNLSMNQIQSMQPICMIRAPLLERIQMSDNQLIDIRSFRKGHFQNITWLNFSNNPINSWYPLTESHLAKLQKFYFKRKPFPILDESINWLLKIESTDLKIMDALTFKRIPQNQVRGMIAQKFLTIKIQWSTI